MKLGALICAGGFILTMFGPVGFLQPVRGYINSTYDKLLHKVDIQYIQINPIGATASSSQPDHPPELAIDAGNNTWWQTASPNKGIGQEITVSFAQPITINKVSVIPGASTDQQTFLQEARPKKVLLVFFNGTNVVLTQNETLQDKDQFQQLAVNAPRTTSMKLEIISVYPSSSGKDTAVTELEFATRT
jgi:hypothetical protein